MKKNFTNQVLCVLLFFAFSAQAQDSLFISELTDPADDYTGRFVELYNAGNEIVDFSSSVFYLSRQSNGGTSWGDLQLSGTVPPGGTFVIGGSGFEALYGFAPDQVSGILTGNGDDAYALFSNGDHTTGVLHDILGVIDVDGTGEAWEYEDSRAHRHVDVRTPSMVWTAPEWEISPANLADCDPGTHYGSVPDDTITPGTYSLTLINDTVTPGQAVELDLLVSELGPADNVISYQFDLDFDTNALEFSGVTVAGTLAEGGTLAINPGIPGRLSVGYMNTNPLIGSGAIAQLQFTALVPDTTELFLSNAFLNTYPVTDLTDGTVFIAETAPPTAVITYSDSVNRYADTLLITATFSEAMAEANPVRLSLSGAVTLLNEDMLRISETVYTFLYPIPKASGEVSILLSNGTDLWGNPVIPEPAGGGNFSIRGFVAGDVNDDGVIQAYDAALTLQYSVGIDPLPGVDPMPWDAWRDSTANVDGNGGITANDAGLILQYSAGIITGFPGAAATKAAAAYVTAEIEDNHIVFYSHGELLGLNINVNEGSGILGSPEVLNNRFMSAINVEKGNYRIGICTAASAAEGEAVLRIPVRNSGPITFQLIENEREREVTLNHVTAAIELEEQGIEIYPNPVSDRLIVSGISCPVVGRVTNIHGQEVLAFSLDGPGELDLANLRAGVYLILFEGDSFREVQRFIKR